MAIEPKNIVVFITHFWDEVCAAQIAKLTRELGANYHIAVAGYVPSGRERPMVPHDIPAYFYDEADLADVAPDNVTAEHWHFFILPRLFLDLPDYAHYWMIEFDVRYTGHWGTLFATLNDPQVAFYGTGMGRRQQYADWCHWATFTTGLDDVAPANFVKCFGPLQRLSAPALAAIQAAIKNGWRGHYEAVWPTAIAHAGWRLEEIGGYGKFTPKSRRGLHYSMTPHDPYLSPGTFVFRPTFQEQDVKSSPPMLWHPVKPADQQTSLPLRDKTRWQRITAQFNLFRND